MTCRLSVLLGLAATTCAGLTAQGQFRAGRLYRPPVLGFGSLYNSSSGDVNGDGHVDLLLARDYWGVSLMINDGRGSFTNETAKRLPRPVKYATYQVDAADMDGDGDLDLVVANDHVNRNKLLINNGRGFFTDQSGRFPPNAHWTTAQAIFDVEGDGDLDADGDPDLYSPGDNAVFMNFHRQLDAVSPPRLGMTYALDFHIRPGYATGVRFALPFFSTRLGQLRIPSLGIFGLARTPLFVLAPVPVSVTGTQTLSVPIPKDTGLRNLLLGYQALVFDGPIRLGNVVADPIL